MPNANLETWGDRKVLTATFDTLGGANLAVKKLQEMEKKDLLDVDNTITVSKNAWDKLDVHQTTGDSARHGAKVGAIVGAVAGLIFPPSILATTALGAAIGGMTGASLSSTRSGKTRSRRPSMAWPPRSAGPRCQRPSPRRWRSRTKICDQGRRSRSMLLETHLFRGSL
jgi:hypothetical protein